MSEVTMGRGPLDEEAKLRALDTLDSAFVDAFDCFQYEGPNADQVYVPGHLQSAEYSELAFDWRGFGFSEHYQRASIERRQRRLGLIRHNVVRDPDVVVHEDVLNMVPGVDRRVTGRALVHAWYLLMLPKGTMNFRIVQQSAIDASEVLEDLESFRAMTVRPDRLSLPNVDRPVRRVWVSDAYVELPFDSPKADRALVWREELGRIAMPAAESHQLLYQAGARLAHDSQVA